MVAQSCDCVHTFITTGRMPGRRSLEGKYRTVQGAVPARINDGYGDGYADAPCILPMTRIPWDSLPSPWDTHDVSGL